MRTKLLLVVNEPWFFVSHRLPIAIAAMSLGYEVHLATNAGSEVEGIERVGIVVHEIPFTRSSTAPLAEIRTLIALYKLYKKIRPDMVHHVTIKPVLYGSFIAQISRVPNIVNAISGLGFVFLATGLIARLRRLIVKIAYRFTFRKPNVIAIFQNPDDKELFLSSGLLNESQTYLIKGSGVDLSKFDVVDEPVGVKTVVLAARMLWDKGVGEFVDAARVLKKRGVNARFCLLGDIDSGNPKAISREQIDVWCSSGMVEWHGFSDNINDVFSKSHIVCLPSYREGLPKVLMEAAACGRAVITTDVPGCRHAIKPDVTGFLVPVKNSSILAKTLEKLILDSELRVQMGKAGRKLAEEEFDINKVIEQHLNIYSLDISSI